MPALSIFTKEISKMLSQGFLVENAKIVLGGVNLLNTAGLAGDRFSMKNFSRVCIIVTLAPASGTDAATITLKQSKTVDDSPSTEKALAFTKYWKNGATGTSDTLVETTASSTFTTSAAAASELFVLEVQDTDLDIANNFDCIRVDVTDPGSVSTPAACIYIGYDAKYPAAPAQQPSAIIN